MGLKKVTSMDMGPSVEKSQEFHSSGNWISRLTYNVASLKFSLAVLLLLLGGLPLSAQGLISATALLTVGGGLFIINLAAALYHHSTFHAQPGLIVFHTALMVLLAAAVVSRLTYFKGAVELTQGEWFHGVAQAEERGPWHSDRLRELRFSHEGFTVEYAPGLKRGATRNQIRWLASDGKMRNTTIGDDISLDLEGYRFRTTANKGFALMLWWIPIDGSQPMRASIHLPSYPATLEQVRHWRIPQTGIRTKATLLLDEVVVDPEQSSQFHLPRRYRLRLAMGDGSVHLLKEGSRLHFTEGILVFEGLRTWMGYRIHYDPAMNWLLASSMTAIFGLAWHYYRQCMRNRWDDDQG